MFEKAKFNKIKNANADAMCIVKVFVSEKTDKKAVKDFLKYVSKNFGNYNDEQASGQTAIAFFCVAEKLENVMNELMEAIIPLKTAETIKFSVNGEEYQI